MTTKNETENVFAVQVGDNYFPYGKTWTENTRLMNYKSAASYVAEVIKNADKRVKITVWERSFVTVECLLYTGNLRDLSKVQTTNYGPVVSEHQYIAQAMRNAIVEKFS